MLVTERAKHALLKLKSMELLGILFSACPDLSLTSQCLSNIYYEHIMRVSAVVRQTVTQAECRTKFKFISLRFSPD